MDPDPTAPGSSAPDLDERRLSLLVEIARAVLARAHGTKL
ncbi:hypothetical protein GCM10011374_04760 [Kocuria dechangensis]|uniref:Uncharacterized protein n=1 Tax=Kocuria dechangensis TaxID=1176249 RepID=A0A917GGS0_9MICC|nr:hypothetical protein GCM10011374_04760 [Kocuria dechangensis]